MPPITNPVRRACWLGLLLGLSACTVKPLVIDVKRPAVSGLRYELPAAPAPARLLSLLDERDAEGQVFVQGTAPGLYPGETIFMADGAPFNATVFLSRHVAAEFASRGLPVTTSVTDHGPPRLHLKTFHIRGHQSAGAAPFVSFTYLSADLESATGRKRIAVFVRRAKVALSSSFLDETISKPLSIAVREFSSKVANALYGYRAPDRAVEELIARLSGPRSSDSDLDVYALGFSNNPLAIGKLVELTQDSNETVRLAAISSLGNIGATGQLALLQSIHQGGKSWVERAMALKAIADLGTAEAAAIVAAEAERVSTQPASKETAWTSALLQLYR